MKAIPTLSLYHSSFVGSGWFLFLQASRLMHPNSGNDFLVTCTSPKFSFYYGNCNDKYMQLIQINVRLLLKFLTFRTTGFFLLNLRHIPVIARASHSACMGGTRTLEWLANLLVFSLAWPSWCNQLLQGIIRLYYVHIMGLQRHVLTMTHWC